MSAFLKRTTKLFVQSIIHLHSFLLSLIFWGICIVATSLHYSMIWYGNWLMWVSFFVSVSALLYSFIPIRSSLETILKRYNNPGTYITLGLILCYLITHFLNFSHAPWNQNGLFDDAAWDIYFAKNHAFINPFQAAFFDNVGYISREVVFHYYITIWFIIFGYNLLVFNIALLFLGGVTVLYATLFIHKLFRNIFVTVFGFLLINFFPLHYMHIFMGHRYAIAAPLMMVSLYYAYTGYTHRSYLKTVVSAIFAALCVSSAVMGKQYFIGFIIGLFLSFVATRSIWKKGEIYGIAFIWIISFLISSTPLLCYVVWNYSNYMIREQSLSQEFIHQLQAGGIIGLAPYLNQLQEVFFAPLSYRRQFLADFYPIPYAYVFFLAPGMILITVRKRFELLLLAILPVFGAFISGAYDFRILLAAPIWIICMSYTISYLVYLWSHAKRKILIRMGISALFSVVIGFGFIPSIQYIWNTSLDPHHQYLLPHKDVAVSRLIQDIVVGVDQPTSFMKWNEFNRRVDMQNVPYDTFVSSAGSYAILHLFLQNYGDKNILSFIDQGTQQLCSSQEALQYHIQAILSYKPIAKKDLLLVWEISPLSEPIISLFHPFATYGYEHTYVEEVDGIVFSLYTLRIRNQFISLFQHQVQLLHL